ncbi:MAG: dephospho-CoA kinase [Planctomycetes bacterium]|nr:dephospho-CoA kinase [Planctomycetota bacterium]
MQVIGIIGGVASGKSFVAQELKQLGAVVLDGDTLGHEVLRRPEVIEALRERWGDEVIVAGGRIDRSMVASIVFADSDEGRRELKFLEQLTHPKIGELLRRQLDELAAAGQAPVVVLDAAVMLKAGWDGRCDRIVFVDAPREVRLARARERGWSAEVFSAREAAQESLDAKRELADVVIDNSSSLELVQAQIEHLWQSLAG